METYTKHDYKSIKVNKHSTQFETVNPMPSDTLLTPIVRVEVFQKYSQATNLGLYFRLRDDKNWRYCTQVTGLWKTMHPTLYYGDYRTSKGKTLLIFRLCPEHSKLTVYEFPIGYYPHKSIIDKLIKSVQ